MKISNATEHHTRRRILTIACATALAVAVTASLPQSAHAGRITPPPVPEKLQVQAGSKAFLEGHGVGTQNYICLPSGAGFAWTLFTPQATLFSDNDKQVTTHFFSPNPDQANTVRATWQHSRDTSTVWAQLAPDGSSSDADFVAPGAVPWLLLDVVGAQEGPTGGAALTAATQIQRLNTAGGVAPATGCAALEDVGKKAFVPYTADYFFYVKHEDDTDDGY
jgi:hypothetical protein